MRERLDNFLVNHGHVETRSQAQALIAEGHVEVDGEVIKKASHKCNESTTIKIKKEKLWVGRGAHKIEGAHKDFQLIFENKIIADMGASTGGFTEYALFHGASEVFAIDVGHDQLAPSLRTNPKVHNLEGVNIKEGLSLEKECDLIVVDLSFISLTMVLAPMISCLKKGGDLVLLVKPQFEVGRENLGKNGIAKDKGAIQEALFRVAQKCGELNCPVVDVALCHIAGKTGNQEYFFHCVYDSNPEGYRLDAIEEKIRNIL